MKNRCQSLRSSGVNVHRYGEVLGAVQMVKDVETRRAWKAGEKPIAFSNQSSDDDDPKPSGNLSSFKMEAAAGDATSPALALNVMSMNMSKSAADAAIDAAHATIDAAAAAAAAAAGGYTVAADDDDGYAPDDATPAMAVPIARPLGSGENHRDDASRSAVWGVITTPGAGATPRGGRGDPDEVAILMAGLVQVANPV
jgi:hypothetical protein